MADIAFMVDETELEYQEACWYSETDVGQLPLISKFHISRVYLEDF